MWNRDDPPYWITLTLAVVVACAAVAYAWHFLSSAAWAEWRPEYAQLYSDEERAWFKAQRNPTTNVPCCDTSDGTYAEEDIRDGHYWAKFTYRKWVIGSTQVEVVSDWMQVPDDTVIKAPNRHGAAVVWWYYQSDAVHIRCFVPGGGV